MNNVGQTIISQYSDSPTLLALIDSMNAAIDPAVDIDNFYDWVWDVTTAQGFGLDIWGRIVGVSRTITTTPPTVLDDADFRSLILLKALSNISIATIPSINSLLRNWVGTQGTAIAFDLGNMMVLYQFLFQLSPVQIAIVTESGFFLRPAGVGAWATTADYPVFGFAEMGTTGAAPFGQAPFMTAGEPYPIA